jgi:DNA-directed RNA polymerase subunit M/transcription elongation factor TFIIS
LRTEIIDKIEAKINKDEVIKCDNCGYLIYTQDAIERNLITPFVKDKKTNKTENTDERFSYEMRYESKVKKPQIKETIVKKYYCKNCDEKNISQKTFQQSQKEVDDKSR